MDAKHRQHLYGLFKSVIYAETESEFQNCQTKLEKDEIAAKYPEYLRHLAKAYGNREETWATYISEMKRDCPHVDQTQTTIARQV